MLPLSLIILVGLFLIQSRGTARIGRLFGPVMVVWFIVLAVLGIRWILRAPQILTAISPHYAVQLVMTEPWTAFVALGSVVLAVTGCEALYADMGHFGRHPIRFAWFALALPALMLNYFGQGASLLIHPDHADTAFYSMAPAWAHYPMIILATLATIIASQAVISGVFSMTRQAVQLGQLPRMEIRHTSMTDYGQIYVPRMNAILLIGVVLIVLIFRNSGNLAAAYGIAVTGVMVIDTFHVSLVAARQWHWGIKLAVTIFGGLGLIDVTMLLSNMLKIPQGGLAAARHRGRRLRRDGDLAHRPPRPSGAYPQRIHAAQPVPGACRQDPDARRRHRRVHERAQRRDARRAAAQPQAQQGAA